MLTVRQKAARKAARTRKVLEAEMWAAKEHIYASDNNVRRRPRPDFLAAPTPEKPQQESEELKSA